MSVYGKRDRVITCVFLLKITPARALKESLCMCAIKALKPWPCLRRKPSFSVSFSPYWLMGSWLTWLNCAKSGSANKGTCPMSSWTMSGSGVYIGVLPWRMYWVAWNTRNARPARKSRDDSKPATGRKEKPVHSVKKSEKNKSPINQYKLAFFTLRSNQAINGYCFLPFKNFDTTSCCGMLSSLKEPI